MADSDLRRLYREQAPRAPEGPFSLERLIEGDGPIELDIGFGRGMSVFERAAAAPESRILGIEVKTKLAYKVSERAKKHGLGNVAILCGDAREILKRAEPDRSVQTVSLHFPDPWWKKRHDKRRVIGEALLDELSTQMPDGMRYEVALDNTIFIRSSIEEVKSTFFEALILVLIVVFLFLGSLRTTLVPLLAIPVSLVGTFALFGPLGFSINMLTLFGLILAIGTVVDDAIVVVESVETYIAKGLDPTEATEPNEARW